MSVEAMTWALAQRTGSVGRKAVLLALANRVGDGWYCWPSQVNVAQQTELSPRQVRRLLKELEEAGFIHRAKRGAPDGGRSSDLITLLHGPTGDRLRERVTGQFDRGGLPDISDRVTGHPEGGLPDTGDRGTVREPSVEPSSPTGPTDDVTSGDVEPFQPQPPAADEASRLDALFDRFWSLYPRKVGKPDAKRAFVRAVRRGDVREMSVGLKRWIAHWDERGEPEFIPHPTTWLNQDRWNDEPPPSARPRGRMTLEEQNAEVLRRLSGQPSDTVIDVNESHLRMVGP